MELKHKLQGFGDVAGTLLIVPYGIETRQTVNLLRDNPELLIVPYGIETLQAPISCLPPAIF